MEWWVWCGIASCITGAIAWAGVFVLLFWEAAS